MIWRVGASSIPARSLGHFRTLGHLWQAASRQLDKVRYAIRRALSLWPLAALLACPGAVRVFPYYLADERAGDHPPTAQKWPLSDGLPSFSRPSDEQDN